MDSHNEISGESHSEAPVTHGCADYSGKVCRCVDCGVTTRCVEAFDFYTTPNEPLGPLRCQRCLVRWYWR